MVDAANPKKEECKMQEEEQKIIPFTRHEDVPPAA